jgi:hypothetical protein
MRQNLSRLRHHCRLNLYYSGIIATPTLMWYYAASCSSMRPNLISFAASCQLKLASCRTTCGIIADLWLLAATYPLLWDLPFSKYCWTNIVSTLLLLGFRSLNVLLAHSIAVNTSHRSFGYYKPGHTSPLLH